MTSRGLARDPRRPSVGPVWDVGIDVGGTKTQILALARGRGQERRLRRANPPGQALSHLVPWTRDLALELVGDGPTPRWGHVGVAFAALLTPNRRSVQVAPNLGGGRGFALARAYEKAFRAPVRIENDADAAAWSEATAQGRRAPEDLLHVVLGTGIGAGLVINGRLIYGASGTAGEIGHLSLGPADARCSCGGYGCVEAVAGGWALAQRARELVRRRPHSVLARSWKVAETPGARELLWAAEAGDPGARKARDDAGRLIGEAMAAAVTVTGLSQVSLGGRLLIGAPGLERALRRSLTEHLAPVVRSRVKVRRAREGDVAAARGALLRATLGPRL